MGKGEELQQSLVDAVDEILLIKASLAKNGKPPLDAHTKIMSSGDYDLFDKLSKNIRIRETIRALQKEERALQSIKNVPKHSVVKILTIDVSNYQPKFLLPLNRVVFYCFSDERADRIAQTFFTI